MNFKLCLSRKTKVSKDGREIAKVLGGDYALLNLKMLISFFLSLYVSNFTISPFVMDSGASILFIELKNTQK